MAFTVGAVQHGVDLDFALSWLCIAGPLGLPLMQPSWFDEWVPAWMRWTESGLGDVESNCPIEAVPMLDEAIQAFLFQRLTCLDGLEVVLLVRLSTRDEGSSSAAGLSSVWWLWIAHPTLVCCILEKRETRRSVVEAALTDSTYL
ncbi:hypothetical protein EDD86DRAFT_220904 [Gorgonomyces haynaldii]|nr:hypothetical protein EDD86DRAFT_220904 [Gorgonomyces haynaldii]